MKIGFVDHHLNNFHANKFLELLRGPLASLGATVTAAWESDPTGEDWCAKQNVPRANSAAAVAEHVDAVMVLAPDNIDAHLSLVKQVVPAGRPLLVDKFLAPTLADAREIVELAERHRVKLFSSSSLRFAAEVDAAKATLPAGAAPTEAFARGMGEWSGYGVHTLALALALLGPDVKRMVNTGTANSAVVTLDYGGDRRATVEVRASKNQWEAFPWSFGVRAGDQYATGVVKDFDGFYANLMRQAVKFFQTGESPITTAEMLKVVAVLEGAERSHRSGTWVDL